MELDSSPAAASLYSSRPVSKASPLALFLSSCGAESPARYLQRVPEGRVASVVVQGAEQRAAGSPRALPRSAEALPGLSPLGLCSSVPRRYPGLSTSTSALAAACLAHPVLTASTPTVRPLVMRAPSFAPAEVHLAVARSWWADRSEYGGAIASMTLPRVRNWRFRRLKEGTNAIC
jgi:hypothetical protein